MHTHQHPPFSFAARDYEMAEENVNAENNECITNHKLEQSMEWEKCFDTLLSNKELKELLIPKLVDGSHVARDNT